MSMSSYLNTAASGPSEPEAPSISHESIELTTRQGEKKTLPMLRDLPLNLVVTVGPHLDASELGPQPENVHVARYIPQDAILPRCDLVVSRHDRDQLLAAIDASHEGGALAGREHRNLRTTIEQRHPG